MSRFLVVDNDAGLDDAWEIFILDKLLSPNDKLLALTCVHGNTDVDYVCANNLRILAELGKYDVPVFKGAASPLISTKRSDLSEDHEFFFGRNGFSDLPLPPIDLPVIQEENAVVALHRLSNEYKGEITLICSGPLTNVALAIRTYSDFAENVKEIYVMGGNYTAMGNTTKCAEFNFYTDPEAAEIVFRTMGGKITLVPWETCLESKVPYEWRTNLTKNGGRITKFLGMLELPVLERVKRLGYTAYSSADSVLGAIVAKPELVTEAFEAYGTVELGGFHTRGQMVIDHLGTHTPNVKIVKNINLDGFKQLLESLKSY